MFRTTFSFSALLVFLVSFAFQATTVVAQSPRNRIAKSILPEILGLKGEKGGCCGMRTVTGRLSAVAEEYEYSRLTGTYYSLRDGFQASLMLNNKGPEPVLANPTFYSMAGTRLQLASIVVPATSYLDVDLQQLLANAGDEFREGSLKISYQAPDQQLGAQIKLTDPQKKLMWAEQLVYTSKFASSRLENVWWLPGANTKTRFVVSNTSSATISATIKVEGTTPSQTTPYLVTLAPWETRVLDILSDLVGNANASLNSTGGISIEHNGQPGHALARMYIARPNVGYSATASFIDPENTTSQRWHGSGFRFHNVDGTKLKTGIAVRNVGTQTSRVNGKIIYTKSNGDLATIALPERQIAAGAAKVFDLSALIDNANIPADVVIGGIEIEYDTPKGTIITSVQSGSTNGEHVFQVPMLDPQKMPSSAGGFPWKADGDYTTIVYIKNETDQPRIYTAHLLYSGSQYSLGVRQLKPGETTAIDFRKIRDDQTPDSFGRIIPLEIDRGQVAWSVKGGDNKTLSGRSEQISLSEGVSSTYACYNCCPDSVYQTELLPSFIELDYGTNGFLGPAQTDMNCYYSPVGPYVPSGVYWFSDNTNVISVFDGELVSGDVGTANISATWDTCLWWVLDGQCSPVCDQTTKNSSAEVKPVVSKIQYKGPNNSSFADATSTLYVLKDTEVTFKAIPDPATATFPSGQPTWSGTSGITGTGDTKSVTFSTVSSSSSNFKTVTTTAGNSSITVNVVVYNLEKVVTPADDFEGRAPTTFGLKELVNLSVNITPSGVTSTQAGGLEWIIASGTGDLPANPSNDGTGAFTAPVNPGNTTLKLNVVSGPSKDKNVTHDVTTVKPSGTYFDSPVSLGRRHTQGRVSAGFKAYVYFEPKNVSFKNIAFSEGACDATDSGYLDGVGTPHAAGPQNQILLCNSSTGCRGFNPDTCNMFHPDNPSPTPYAAGSWNWAIPWSYHYGSESGSLFTVNQLLTTDASGNATISKGGVSVTFNVNDPTVSTGGTW